MSGILGNTPAFVKYFDADGHIHGGRWYATVLAGIEIEEFDDRIKLQAVKS
ncbi:hypothetical protein [Cohnella endophytica]|uniref:hypothetical protein n=1 Tax=Cohnella endophytica TaxID=2419778 RepID=UPI0013149F8C|nr:hypothetical protein [Cohnella endophytica]